MRDTVKAGLWLLLFVVIVFFAGYLLTGCTPVYGTDPTVPVRPAPVEQVAQAAKDALAGPEARSIADRVPYGGIVLAGLGWLISIYLESRRRSLSGDLRDALRELPPVK